ncbi:MAG: glycosyltransferase family 2 protein [Thermoprotei archaeon]|nr:glycosyltransferase family 2 protein [Thermoprotei archaeon]
MKEPFITIIWVNYNSMNIIDLVLSSLVNIRNLDYDNYDLIIVDNASTDGSFQMVKSFVERWVRPKVKIIRMDRNRGWIGGCNAGYARVKSSDYVVVMNNDLIPFPDSLRGLVEHLMQDENVGGAQGIILDYNTKRVQTAGYIDDELLRAYTLFPSENPSSIRKSYLISYSTGAYSIYRVRSLRLIGRTNYLYDPELFAYYDDHILGLRFWMNNFKVKLLPVKAGLHYEGATFRESPVKSYIILRNRLATVFMSNIRWKYYTIMFALIRHNLYPLTRRHRLPWSMQKRALSQALRISRLMVRREGPLNIYKAPIIRLSPTELFMPSRIIRSKLENIIKSLEET